MSNPLTIFQVAGKAMSAQLVRMNTTASNLANAGGIASSEAGAYRTMKPVFRTEYDKATGLATVNVESIVTAGESATKHYDPSHPMADKDGNVWESAVDETREMVDMMETARSYQNNVEVMQTAKSLILDYPQDGPLNMSAFDTTLNNLGINRTTTSPTVAAAGATQQLGQNDFLKLMTAQLKNQDPFSPVDNTQMVAQMASFSSLSGITEMNTTLKGISDKLGATSTADALSYVGRNVLTEGATAYGRSTGGIAGAVEVDGDTTNLKVTITAADGQVLKNVDLGKQSKGTVQFEWDGKTDAGAEAGSGPFTVTASASNNNKAVTSRTLVWAPVASVAIPASGAAQLTLPGIGTIPVTAVRQVG